MNFFKLFSKKTNKQVIHKNHIDSKIKKYVDNYLMEYGDVILSLFQSGGEDTEEDIEEKREFDINKLNDLGMAETVSDVDEDVELDLDELKGEINKHVDATLSKYFK